MTRKTRVRGVSPAIDRYLAELDERTCGLPADEQKEIVSSIEDHIADELGGNDVPSASVIRAILSELGSVDSIVEATQVTPDGANAHGAWFRYGCLLTAVVALILAWPYPPLGFLLGVAAIVLGLVLRRSEGGRRTGSAAVILGMIAVIVTCLWALTSISTGAHGTPGPSPAPALRSQH